MPEHYFFKESTSGADSLRNKILELQVQVIKPELEYFVLISSCQVFLTFLAMPEPFCLKKRPFVIAKAPKNQVRSTSRTSET